MRRLDRGLWIGSWDTIAVAARAVADHPTVPPEEVQRISGVLGDDMSAFRDMAAAARGARGHGEPVMDVRSGNTVLLSRPAGVY